MITANIIDVGNSSGAIFSKELLIKLKAKKGDTLVFTESDDGVMKVNVMANKLKEQMQAADRVIEKYHAAFKELANR